MIWLRGRKGRMVLVNAGAVLSLTPMTAAKQNVHAVIVHGHEVRRTAAVRTRRLVRSLVAEPRLGLIQMGDWWNEIY